MRLRSPLFVTTALVLAGCAGPAAPGRVLQALDGEPVDLRSWIGGPSAALLGSDVEIGFELGNYSPVAATNVVARLEITGAFAPIGDVSDPIPGCAFRETPGHATYDCLLPTLDADSYRWTRVFVHPTAVGQVTFTSVIRSDEPELGPGDNQASLSVGVYDQPITDLYVFRGKVPKPPIGGGPGDVVVGYPAPSRFFVGSHGPSDSTGSRVELLLTGPAHFTEAVTAECTRVSDTRVSCAYGHLAPWEMAEPPYALFLATDVGEITVTASVTSNELDPVPENNVAMLRYQAYVPKLADVAVTVAATADRLHFKSPLTYTVTATNHGPDVADSVFLEHYVDSSITNLSATPSQGSCEQSNDGVWCQLGALAAGQSATLVIVAQPSLGGTFTDSAWAWNYAPRTLDPDRTNNGASTTLTLRGPNPPVTVTTTSQRYPVESWGYLECAADEVYLHGEAQQVSHWQWNRTRQSGLFLLRESFQGVRGEGISSGRTYHAAAGWSTQQRLVVDGGYAQRSTSHVNLISEGGGPNLVAHLSYRFEVDRDGNVTTELERSWVTCR